MVVSGFRLCYTLIISIERMVKTLISIDDMQKLMDDMTEELPPEFFDELNGGVLLLPDTILDEHSSPDDPLYIMGEYHRGGEMGRYIAIYYGSFAAVFEGLSGEYLVSELQDELRTTIRHEFRHHLESLAGADDLEREDEAHIDSYLRNARDD